MILPYSIQNIAKLLLFFFHPALKQDEKNQIKTKKNIFTRIQNPSQSN